MLISHSRRFIFIHNYKVAGSSIRDTLAAYSNLSFQRSSLTDKIKLVLGIYPKIYSHDFHGHIKAFELKGKLPKKTFDDYFKFGFVRNPWDWQVSLYTYALNLPSHHQHLLVKEMKGFDDYIDWRIDKELRLQKDFFYSPEGKCLVDFVGKFENLETDFVKICDRLQIKANLSFLNQSKRNKNPLDYYSQRSIDRVYDAFREDIELFGYSKPVLK